MTHHRVMVSRPQRLHNLVARTASKPLLARVRPLWLLRALLELGGPMFFRAPRGLQCTSVGPRLYRITTPAMKDAHGTLLYIHGGGFVSGGLRSYRHLAARLAEAAGMHCTFVDYRLAPAHPFPAALNDAEAAYRALLDMPETGPICIAGDSAGGHILFALLHRLGAKGLPRPAAAAAICPATDLRGVNPSLHAHARSERVLPERMVRDSAAAYLGGADPGQPELSPVLGDFTGCGPVIIHVDRGEILYDDACQMARKLRADGVTVQLDEASDLFHVWHINAGRSPEATAAVAALGAFLKRHSADPTP